VDIRGVKIDQDLPVEQRALRYIEQIKNPYLFRVGDIAVNVQFTPEGRPLKEAVVSYLTTLKNSV